MFRDRFGNESAGLGAEWRDRVRRAGRKGPLGGIGGAFGPFGPLGPLGPLGPFGPFSPLRRRGVWKYVVAAAIARTAANQVARRVRRDRRKRRLQLVPNKDRDQRAQFKGWRDVGRRIWQARQEQEQVKQEPERQEEDTMPRWDGLGERPQGRRFDRGDMKYVLLDLLREGPRHGYDMIKELERRSDGSYTPSPGSIYPTLQMLEDQGLVTSTTVDGKRTYRLTDGGYAFIEERADRADDARGRAWGSPPWADSERIRDEVRTIGREAGDLARQLRDTVRQYAPDQHQVNEIRDVLGEARKRIEAIMAERRESGSRPDDRDKPTTV